MEIRNLFAPTDEQIDEAAMFAALSDVDEDMTDDESLIVEDQAAS